jgi:AAA domain/UvrD-like helicase C-terminal domain
MPQLTPTAEQQAIIDAYRTGQNLVIEAGAGTGKTSTLKMLAAAAPDRSGFYIAYNRAIAKDAGRSFPGNIECRTAHSLAFRAVGSQFKARLDGPRQPARIVAQLLRINPLRVDESLMLSPTQVARVVNDTVANFCRSADAEIAWRHVPKIAGIDLPEPRGRLRGAVVPLARKAWADLSRPEGKLRFQHDHYLKLWQLTGPRLDVDVVMLDEAQDANPLIADIVERQTHAQRVMVGDQSQAIYCQPAGTMVRVPVQASRRTRPGERPWTFQEQPIESLQVGDRVVSYSQSGQFGAIRKRGCEVTGITRRPWHGPLKIVVTDSGRNSAYTPDHHCIIMLGDSLRGQYPVYLARRGEHYRVGSCEGRYASQGDAFGPLLRARQEGADAIWILSVHATRRAALAEEALTQTFHNIPGRCFLSEGGADYWKDRPSNRQAAAELLMAFGLLIDAPLFDLREELLRSDQKGIHTWRTPLVTQARNLLDGMWVLLADRTVRHSRSETVRVSSWEPVKVLDEWYDGEVISISVDGDHTYIADGIATHNSWNGAIDALSRFDADARLRLSESFRFGPPIAAEANKWLSILGASLRLTGRAKHTSSIAELPEPDAILCRTNAGAVAQLMAAAEQGRRAALVGGGDAIKRLAEAALDLQRDMPTSHPELMAFMTWGQVREYVEQESAGSDLKVFVRLIDDHGAPAVIATMERLVDERYAQVVVSTAHKAKGREWNGVRVASDFHEPKPGKDDEPGEIRDDEAMLAYVTVTRARKVLDRGGLRWVDGWVSGPVAAVGAEQLALAEQVAEEAEAESASTEPPSREQIAGIVAAQQATAVAEQTLTVDTAEQAVPAALAGAPEVDRDGPHPC